jgi:hypothetical protein
MARCVVTLSAVCPLIAGNRPDCGAAEALALGAATPSVAIARAVSAAIPYVLCPNRDRKLLIIDSASLSFSGMRVLFTFARNALQRAKDAHAELPDSGLRSGPH